MHLNFINHKDSKQVQWTEHIMTHMNTRYKVETQCGWKPPTAMLLYLLVNKKLPFTIFLYWCNLIPVRILLPTEGYNLLSFSSFSWKGATTLLALLLSKILVHRCWPTEGYYLLFSSGDHVSSIFRLDPWILSNHQVYVHHPINQ